MANLSELRVRLNLCTLDKSFDSIQVIHIYYIERKSKLTIVTFLLSNTSIKVHIDVQNLFIYSKLKKYLKIMSF